MPYAVLSITLKPVESGDSEHNKVTTSNDERRSSEKATEELENQMHLLNESWKETSNISREPVFREADLDAIYARVKESSFINDTNIDVPAIPKTQTSSPAAFDAAYRAQKLKSWSNGAPVKDLIDASETRKTTSKIHYIVAGKEDAIRKHEIPSSPDTSAPVGTIVRKFLSGHTGRQVTRALRQASKRQQAMEEKEQEAFKNSLSHGASTAEALRCVHMFKEERSSSESYVDCVPTREFMRTNPKDVGLIRRNGVGKNDPQQNANHGFRIFKHASNSAYHKAMESRDRNPVSPRKQAMGLHRENCLALNDARSKDRPMNDERNIRVQLSFHYHHHTSQAIP